MIVIKNNKLEVEEPENVQLNGVYYALVINAQFIDENTWLCYIYIPEVYGPYDHIFDTAFNYPRVEVPNKQDPDDPGYQPQTGDLLKVSFDDGNINSCRFIMLVPISNLTRQINADYITNGYIGSSIIENITDPNILNKIREWLPQAYFITIGTREPNKNSFIMKALITANTAFSNYFLTPLSVPVSSNSIRAGTDITSPIPVYSTNLYVLMDVIYKLYNEQPDQLISLFTGINQDREIKEDFGKLNETEQAQYVALLLAGLIPDYVNVMFPDANEDNFNLWNDKIYSTDPRLFYKHSQTKLSSETLSISEYFYNNKTLFETEWVSTIASWWSGLNNIIDKNNIKLIKIVLYCLTICPWLANAVIRYSIEDLSIFEKISFFHDKYNNVLDRYLAFSLIQNSNYSTIFKTNEEFVNVGTILREAIDSQDLHNVINTFEQQMKALCDGKVDGGHMEPLGPEFEDISYWDFCEMSQKFERLRNTILPEIEAEV